jgi:hypothetical protein
MVDGAHLVREWWEAKHGDDHRALVVEHKLLHRALETVQHQLRQKDGLLQPLERVRRGQVEFHHIHKDDSHGSERAHPRVAFVCLLAAAAAAARYFRVARRFGGALGGKRISGNDRGGLKTQKQE